MSAINITINVTTDEIKTAIEDYVHRKYGYMWANMQGCERYSDLHESTGPDGITAKVTVEKLDD